MLTLALLAALGAAHARPPAVTARPVGIRDPKIGLQGASFVLEVEVERQRGLGARLRGLDYSLAVSEVRVAEQHVDYDGVRLRKGRPVRVRIPVKISAGDALEAGLQSFTRGSLRVQLSGEADLRVLLIPFSLPFEADLADLSLSR